MHLGRLRLPHNHRRTRSIAAWSADEHAQSSRPVLSVIESRWVSTGGFRLVPSRQRVVRQSYGAKPQKVIQLRNFIHIKTPHWALTLTYYYQIYQKLDESIGFNNHDALDSVAYKPSMNPLIASSERNSSSRYLRSIRRFRSDMSTYDLSETPGHSFRQAVTHSLSCASPELTTTTRDIRATAKTRRPCAHKSVAQ